jgi:hypothetical protein
MSHIHVPEKFLCISAILKYILFIAEKNMTISATLDAFCKAEVIPNIARRKTSNCFGLYLHDAT